MQAEESEAKLADTRAAYFRAADAVLQKIQRQYGSDREGFLRLLNRKIAGDPPETTPQQ